MLGLALMVEYAVSAGGYLAFVVYGYRVAEGPECDKRVLDLKYRHSEHSELERLAQYDSDCAGGNCGFDVVMPVEPFAAKCNKELSRSDLARVGGDALDLGCASRAQAGEQRPWPDCAAPPGMRPRCARPSARADPG